MADGAPGSTGRPRGRGAIPDRGTAARSGAERPGPEEFVHTGLVFRSLRALADAVVPVVRAAHREGGRILVVLGDVEREAVSTVLPPPLRRAAEFRPRSAFYTAPGRTLAALHRLARSSPGRPVTVVGQPVLPEGDPLALDEWRLLDSVLNLALARHRIRLFCVHDAGAVPAAALDGVWRTHPTVSDGGGPRPSPRYRTPDALGAELAARPLAPLGEPAHRIRISADLGALRAEVARLAARLEVPGGRAEDLVVAVNELAANVLEHGAGRGTVALWRRDGRVVCDVFDEAGGLTDPLGGYRVGGALGARGHGLWITRQVCDFMEVRGGPGGSLVRVHLRL
ncbi:anti-sigma factor RsbA family regulatory protein [Thermobifida cellulosilytica]|uniref:anti-sigma factor RsbA family regulatory protein n=1 Tax=Thermobifida cellulosilytica TaxID=144786 RepID=UPI0008380516|nr:anti-sigma factor RsbA family regulatory protein [Thermobifida cellulosilytica]